MLRFIQEQTGLHFPSLFYFQQEYDNGEFYARYRFFIVDKNHFLSTNQQSVVLCNAHELIRVITPIPKPPQTNNTVCFCGITKYSNWNAFFESTTGVLWVEIQYPDSGGSLRPDD